MFTSLLPPNSDHVMIHLGGYNCAICYVQLSAWEYVQTEQLQPPKWIITWSELGGNWDVNTLAESVYRQLRNKITFNQIYIHFLFILRRLVTVDALNREVDSLLSLLILSFLIRFFPCLWLLSAWCTGQTGAPIQKSKKLRWTDPRDKSL